MANAFNHFMVEYTTTKSDPGLVVADAVLKILLEVILQQQVELHHIGL